MAPWGGSGRGLSGTSTYGSPAGASTAREPGFSAALPSPVTTQPVASQSASVASQFTWTMTLARRTARGACRRPSSRSRASRRSCRPSSSSSRTWQPPNVVRIFLPHYREYDAHGQPHMLMYLLSLGFCCRDHAWSESEPGITAKCMCLRLEPCDPQDGRSRDGTLTKNMWLRARAVHDGRGDGDGGWVRRGYTSGSELGRGC